MLWFCLWCKARWSWHNTHTFSRKGIWDGDDDGDAGDDNGDGDSDDDDGDEDGDDNDDMAMVM